MFKTSITVYYNTTFNEYVDDEYIDLIEQSLPYGWKNIEAVYTTSAVKNRHFQFSEMFSGPKTTLYLASDIIDEVFHKLKQQDEVIEYYVSEDE